MSFWIPFLVIFFTGASNAVGSPMRSPSFEQEVFLVVPWQHQSKGEEIFQQKLTDTFPVAPSSRTKLILTDNTVAPELSAGDIIKALREIDGKATFVCYGRAAADCLEAFLRHPKLAKRRVGQMVSLQGLVRGSTEAEGVEKPWTSVDVTRAQKIPLLTAMKIALQWGLSFLRPHEPALYAMSPKVRRDYLKKHRSAIHELSQHINFFSLDDSAEKYGVLPFSEPVLAVSKRD